MAGRVVSSPGTPVVPPPVQPGYQQPYDQSTPSYYSPPGINLPRPANVNRGRYDTGQILVNPTPGVTPTIIQGGVGPGAGLPPQTYAPPQGELPPLDPNQQNFEQMDLHDWLAAQAANPTASSLAQSLATTQSKMAQYQPGGGAYDPTLASQSADGYSFVAAPGTTLPPNVIDQIYPNGPPPVPPPPTDGYPQTYPGWGEPGGPTPPPGWSPPVNWDKYYTPPLPDWTPENGRIGGPQQGFPPGIDPYPNPYPNSWPRNSSGQPYSWPNIPPFIGTLPDGTLGNPYAFWLQQQNLGNSGFAPSPGQPFPSWWYPYQLPPWGGTGDPPAPPPDPNGINNPYVNPSPA